MEANFFRALGRDLARMLPGARPEKIFFPAPDVWTMALSGLSRSRFEPLPSIPKYLLGRFGPGRSLLFFSDVKPENPARPPAEAMRLRKRLKGRRVVSVVCDWANRSLALALSPSPVSDAATHLCIDPKKGLALTEGPPQGCGLEPEWPQLDMVLENPEVWRAFPQISPPLRRALRALADADHDLAAAMLDAVRRGGGGTYYLYGAGGRPRDVLPFPLPESLCRGLDLETFDSAAAAAAAFGRPLLFARVSAGERREASAEGKAALRKRKRRLERLDRDERRMRRFIAMAEAGEAVAANLHALDPRRKTASISVAHPEKGPMDIALDPSRTIVENMQRFFNRAAKGKRGLAHIERLRREVERETPAPPPAAAPGGAGRGAPPESHIPKKYKGEAVRLYRSSDGFLLVRGRNAKANDRLLTRLAGPHDLWFHVTGGPGAHVILKRDHPGQETPRQSLLEAAALAGLAGHSAGAAKAEIMMADVRDVRKCRGAARGAVTVDKTSETFRVALDPELEKRLKIA